MAVRRPAWRLLDHLEEYRVPGALRRVTEDLRVGVAGLGFPVLPTASAFWFAPGTETKV
ncbi:MAG: hypothetical protein RMK65_01430 [Anaerolineae bacterium]|nr:hypothetical protein [Anaerolineae bacterium]